jgi:hypothetical protein
VPVLGTIHAVIGTGDAHRRLSRGKQPDPERVLSALARLLEPPLGSPWSGSRPANSNDR